MPIIQPMRAGPRAIDDQTLNNRIRQLQEQKNQIAQMALKYELEDNSTVDTLSLLTIRNHRMGHHHKQAGADGQELAAQDRKGRLAEYHKMTNERRK